jgi:lysozyme
MKSFLPILTFLLLISCIELGCSKHKKSQHNSEIKLPFSSSVYGIDISHHQGKINWEQVKKWKEKEIKFVYIKATEGGTHVDSMYEKNIEGARNNGFLTGSYHYFRSSSLPKDQFENFKKIADIEHQDLIPLVDVEERKNWDDKTFHINFQQFLDLIEEHYGKKPMIYTVNSFYNKNLAGKYKKYHFLIGRYGENEPFMKDEHRWTLWQLSETGSVVGIPKAVDIDVLNPEFTLDTLLLRND